MYQNEYVVTRKLDEGTETTEGSSAMAWREVSHAQPHMLRRPLLVLRFEVVG